MDKRQRVSDKRQRTPFLANHSNSSTIADLLLSSSSDQQSLSPKPCNNYFSQGSHTNCPLLQPSIRTKMHLMFYLDPAGKRVYTLKVSFP
jgi:hypothetical protein